MADSVRWVREGASERAGERARWQLKWRLPQGRFTFFLLFSSFVLLLLCCDYENIELRDCELSVIDRNGRAESAAQEQLPGLHFRASRDDAWSHWHTRLKRTLNNVAKKQGAAAAAAVATALRKGYQETAFIFFSAFFFGFSALNFNLKIFG